MNAAEAVKKEEKNADRSQESSKPAGRGAGGPGRRNRTGKRSGGSAGKARERGRASREGRTEARSGEAGGRRGRNKAGRGKVEGKRRKEKRKRRNSSKRGENNSGRGPVQGRTGEGRGRNKTGDRGEKQAGKGGGARRRDKKSQCGSGTDSAGKSRKTDEAGEQEKNSIRERLLCQNTLPPIRTVSSHALSGTGAGTEAMTEGKTDAMTEARTEARTDRRSARPRSRRRLDGGMSAREWAENLAAPRGLNRDCKTEATIKADDRAFIPLHELDDGCSHQRMWARLRRKYPKILAFDYEPGCEILTIKPQDIGLLPREAWIFGNNSFLLHGYYSYRYLILARLENPGGEPRYLLGVPGHYSSNEKYMASMFGFSDFIMSKKQPSGDDCFGYWYTDVRVGN